MVDGALKQSQKSTNEQNSSESSTLVEVKQIADTPFTAVRNEDKWFLALGKFKLSQTVGSEEEVIEMSKDTSWSRLMNIMFIVATDAITEYHDKHHGVNKAETLLKQSI